MNRIALRLHKTLPACVDLEDLVQDGVFGLALAIEVFDRARGVRFPTFAQHKIKGAILDALREYSWYPRLVLDRRAQVAAARERLRQQLGHEPGEAELAAAAPADVIEEAAFAPELATLRDANLPPQWAAPHAGCLSAEIRAAILFGLTPTERLIIQCYLFDGLTMKETAAAAGLSEVAVSQRINGHVNHNVRMIGLIDRLRDRVRLRELAGVPLDADCPRPRSEAIRHAVHGYSSISQNRKRWPVVRKGAAAARREGARRQGSPAGATGAQSANSPAQDGHASHTPIPLVQPAQPSARKVPSQRAIA